MLLEKTLLIAVINTMMTCNLESYNTTTLTKVKKQGDVKKRILFQINSISVIYITPSFIRLHLCTAHLSGYSSDNISMQS